MEQVMMKLQIGVIGGSQPDDEHRKLGFEVGRLLSDKGVIVICGGLTGIMDAVAEGVEAGGGMCIGILPGISPLDGNRHLTVGLPTGIGFARNFLIVRASDALIAIDGSSGTLSEASFAIAEGKSVISLDSFKLARQKETEGNFIIASSPSEAVKLAVEEATRKREAFGAGRVRVRDFG